MATYSTADDGQQEDGSHRRFWNGTIAFASFMLLLLGGFHLFGGFIALLEDEKYLVGEEDLVVAVNYRAWGIAHMAFAVGMIFASYGLFWRKTWARVLAVVVALLSAIGNLAFLAAYPIWYGLMIGVDILVIYAVTVHAGQDPDYF